MAIDPRTPITTQEQKLAYEIADLKRRIAALEQVVHRLTQVAP